MALIVSRERSREIMTDSALVGVMSVLLPGPDNAPYTQTVPGQYVTITLQSNSGNAVTADYSMTAACPT